MNMSVPRLISFSRLLLLASLSQALINYDEEDCAACKITTATILEDFGYPAEIHSVFTHDGYNITIFRVPHGKNNNKREGKVPVMFQYGADASSDGWVNTYDSSDCYVTRLAELDYDVWLSNIRGSRYGKHEKYSMTDFKYWNYTLDDVALIDAKATVDFILNETRQPSLSFIGHSMGAAVFTLLLSDLPEYNDKVHYAQLMSPVLFTGNNKHLIVNVFNGRKPIIDPLKLKLLEFLADNGLVNTFVATTAPASKMFAKICERSEFHSICGIFAGILIGHDLKNFPDKNLEVFFEGFGQGYALKPMVQFGQMALKDDVQKFDYHERNLEVYGSQSPPKYNLSNVRIPIQLYCPKNDYLLDLKDCEKYRAALVNANVSKHVIENEKFNHFDYLYGEPRLKFLDVAVKDFENFHARRMKTLSSTND